MATFIPAAFQWPFQGLAWPWETLLAICLVVVVAMLLWSLLLFVRAHAAITAPPPVPENGADGFSWVFLVPALNEEVTVADSVARLLAIPLRRAPDHHHRRRLRRSDAGRSSPRSTTRTYPF